MKNAHRLIGNVCITDLRAITKRAKTRVTLTIELRTDKNRIEMEFSSQFEEWCKKTDLKTINVSVKLNSPRESPNILAML